MKSLKGSKTERNIFCLRGETRRGTGTRISPAKPERKDISGVQGVRRNRGQEKEHANACSSSRGGEVEISAPSRPGSSPPPPRT
jgi:hypothetical protein